MRIVAGNPFAQGKQARLQSVAVLFLLNDAHRLTANHFRRRQIRFTETEADTPRLRPIRNLPDHALFDAVEEKWWPEVIQRSKSSNCVAASVFSSRYFTITEA